MINKCMTHSTYNCKNCGTESKWSHQKFNIYCSNTCKGEAQFKETIERLKTTFEQTNLEKLQNLYFDFNNEEPNLSIDESEITGTENFEFVGEREEKGQKRTRTPKRVVSETNEEI